MKFCITVPFAPDRLSASLLGLFATVTVAIADFSRIATGAK